MDHFTFYQKNADKENYFYVEIGEFSKEFETQEDSSSTEENTGTTTAPSDIIGPPYAQTNTIEQPEFIVPESLPSVLIEKVSLGALDAEVDSQNIAEFPPSDYTTSFVAVYFSTNLDTFETAELFLEGDNTPLNVLSISEIADSSPQVFSEVYLSTERLVPELFGTKKEIRLFVKIDELESEPVTIRLPEDS